MEFLTVDLPHHCSYYNTHLFIDFAYLCIYSLIHLFIH